MSREAYEVYAVKYATRDGTRSANFIGRHPHDAPMPKAYCVWLIRNAERTFVVDTGFSEGMARQRTRTLLRIPSAGLALLRVEAVSGNVALRASSMWKRWSEGLTGSPRATYGRSPLFRVVLPWSRRAIRRPPRRSRASPSDWMCRRSRDGSGPFRQSSLRARAGLP